MTVSHTLQTHIITPDHRRQASTEGAIRTGHLMVKGKGGKIRTVPINESIRIELRRMLERTERGHKLFVPDGTPTHIAINQMQGFIYAVRDEIQDPDRERPMTHHGLRHTYAARTYQEKRADGTSEPDAYRKLYAQMVEDGWLPDEIKKAMETRMKKAQDVSSVTELDRRYLSPESQDVYDKTIRKLESGRLWKQASEAQRSEARDRVYAFLTRKGGAKEAPKWDRLEATGVDAYEYASAMLGRELFDEPNKNGNYGSYTEGEVQKAVEAVPSLTREERIALWIVLGKQEGKAPW